MPLAPRAIRVRTASGWQDIALQGPAGPSAPDATPTVKGVVQLAGGLAGTAAAPQIAANAVGTTQLANDAVNAAKILDGSVGTAELANAAATFAKLGNWYPFLAQGNYSFLADTNTRIITSAWSVQYDPAGCFSVGGNAYVAPGPGLYAFWTNWGAGFGADSYTQSCFNYNNQIWFGATNGYLRSSGDSVEGLTNMCMLKMNGADAMYIGGWSSVGGTIEVRWGGFRIPVA